MSRMTFLMEMRRHVGFCGIFFKNPAVEVVTSCLNRSAFRQWNQNLTQDIEIWEQSTNRMSLSKARKEKRKKKKETKGFNFVCITGTPSCKVKHIF